MITSARTPLYATWLRDLLLGKGSITHYWIIGEIDVRALLQLQSRHRSPAKPFTPVPDRFAIDFSRKVLSAGEKE